MTADTPGPQAGLSLEFAEVTPETWPDFEALFEGRGGPKNCWCMIFRVTPEEGCRTDKASRKAAMERRVRGNTPVGILGYVDGEPAAWCSVAPRATFNRLSFDDGQDEVWSLTCFFIRSGLRGSGISRQLLKAAIEHARSNGARVLEAYPVDHNSPSYRFGGFVSTFESVGFTEVGMVGSRRHRMQLKVG